jgi:hypothetical protein
MSAGPAARMPVMRLESDVEVERLSHRTNMPDNESITNAAKTACHQLRDTRLSVRGPFDPQRVNLELDHNLSKNTVFG